MGAEQFALVDDLQGFAGHWPIPDQVPVVPIDTALKAVVEAQANAYFAGDIILYESKLFLSVCTWGTAGLEWRVQKHARWCVHHKEQHSKLINNTSIAASLWYMSCA